MSDHKACDHCGKEIPDFASNVDMTQLTTWEDEGGMTASYVETIRDFCDMKCTAKFAMKRTLDVINGQGVQS
jgi:hypothetical protein